LLNFGLRFRGRAAVAEAARELPSPCSALAVLFEGSIPIGSARAHAFHVSAGIDRIEDSMRTRSVGPFMDTA
jgi:hypothetical protein